MGIKRANYDGKICIAAPIGTGWYRCKFANGDILRLQENKLTLFNNTPNQEIKF